MIDSSVVSRIIETANIVDVIGDFVTIKKKGVNYTACCPFHNEKTPSFSISPSKGIFKCFGCGKAGSAVGFIMEHEHFTYVEALRYLAKKYNIEIQEKEQSAEELIQRNDRESMMIVSGFAQQYFSEQLKTNEGKAIGASYFKERGFNGAILEKFQLGYSPESRTALAEAAQKAGYKAEYLVKSGLCYVRESDQALGDRFAGRVIFPIHSLSGRVIAFGGRTLRTDKKVAKYLNSPESDIYQKRYNLYGIFFAKQSISKLDKCYLVEGYTDVLSMYQAGIENVVASSGTSLTTEQIHMIGRFTNNVTILFDGDTAGIKASLRGIDMLLEQGMRIKVCLLDDGEDPDSFAKKHSASEIKTYLDAKEEDFLTFKIRLLLGDAVDDPDKKSSVIKDVVQSIAVIPDLITRSVYTKACSKLLDIDEDVLKTQITTIRHTKVSNQRTTEFKEEQAAARQNTADTGDVPPVDFFLPDDINMGTSITKAIPGFVCNIICLEQERELVMWMLRNGREPLFKIEEEGEEKIICVDEYIIIDIKNDDLEFENLRFKSLFDAYQDYLLSDATDKSAEAIIRHLINLPDPELVSEVINLMTDPYELSEIWGPVKTQKIDLQLSIPKAINVYKSKVVLMAVNEMAQKIKEASSRPKNENEENPVNELNEIIKQIQILNKQRMYFATTLGRIMS